MFNVKFLLNTIFYITTTMPFCQAQHGWKLLTTFTYCGY